MANEIRRKEIATAILSALESQAGLDTLPARAAVARILAGVGKATSARFKWLGAGRSRTCLEIEWPGADRDLVLILANKPSIARDIVITLAYPEDRAKLYGASDYAVIAEKAEMVHGFDDPRIKTEEFAKRADELNARYIGLSNADIGFIGDKVVVIGSSIRIIKKDAVINGRCASQQQRAV